MEKNIERTRRIKDKGDKKKYTEDATENRRGRLIVRLHEKYEFIKTELQLPEIFLGKWLISHYITN